MKRIIIFALALFCTCAAWAQHDIPLSHNTTSDLQGRLKVAMDIPLSKKFTLTWGEEGRVKENMAKMDMILSELLLKYKIKPFLEATTNYTLLTERVGRGWQNKHRSETSLTGKVQVGQFDLSLRELMMIIWNGFQVDKRTTPQPSLTMRTQLKGSYRNDSRWTPYAYGEVFILCNARDRVDNIMQQQTERKSYVSCLRMVAGTEMKLDQKNKMTFYYMYNLERSFKASYDGQMGALQEWMLGAKNAHVVGIEYKFSL